MDRLQEARQNRDALFAVIMHPLEMKTTFTYTVLRYVHDIATGEFVNMGVALYAPEAKYVSAICNSRYGRLSRMFLEVNGDNLRSLMRYIQARFEEHAAKLNSELALEKPKSVMEIAASILPRDDSSLQWSEPNGGFTEDPAATLEQLYTRLVEKYEQQYDDKRTQGSLRCRRKAHD